jgi:hypothetical protein
MTLFSVAVFLVKDSALGLMSVAIAKAHCISFEQKVIGTPFPEPSSSEGKQHSKIN